jgi:hypothetical protein
MKISNQLHALRFTTSKRAPGIHGIGSWVGPTAGQDTAANRKIPAPTGNQTPAVYHIRLNENQVQWGVQKPQEAHL